MAHLWARDGDTGWKVLPLDDDRYTLAGDPEDGVSARAGGPVAGEPALVRATDAAGRERWVLVSAVRTYARVNGDRVPGIRVVLDKDEISAPQLGPFYLSTESLAKIEPYTGPADASCPRCLQLLEQGKPAVRCPKCSTWHHQDQEKEWECWTHLERCQLCDQSTRLDADYQWRPEEP
ncbi:MAG: hypothetical protein ACYS1B_17245 [Planctomycetota bacterium]|jgi:hypothetical protein